MGADLRTKTLVPNIPLNSLATKAHIPSMPWGIWWLKHPLGLVITKPLFPRISLGFIGDSFLNSSLGLVEPQSPFSSTFLGQLEKKIPSPKMSLK